MAADRPNVDRLNDATLTRLSAPIAATLAGLWAERLSRAFWPFWTLLLCVLSALAFGIADHLPLEAAWFALIGTAAGLAVTAVLGLRAFRRPRRADAIARLDATLPGRPLATLADRQAVGEGDAASAAVWAVHRERMAARALSARPVAPDLKLSARDPFGLRYVALTLAVLAALFGSAWRVADVTGLAPGRAEALAAGPAWEGWIQPPPYTGLPTIYLNEVAEGELRVPQGSRVQLRLYGEIGALTVAETVSGRPGTAVPPASEPAQEFDVARSGQVEIAGPGGRRWVIGALRDASPTIAPTGPATQGRDGEMRLPFQATDDYGVTGAQATVTLDLDAVDRRYGLTIEPEPREPLILDIALPLRGERTDFQGELIDDISTHPFANLPVVLVLSARDAAAQEGQAAPLRLRLPGKRFFDPLAAALIEMRRDLLWNRANGPEAARILRAVTHRPEGFIRNEKAWLRLRVLMRRLDAEAASLAPAARDEIAAELWEIALMVEEGDLASTLERLQRAQDRLDEAIRNGADPSEIERLMQEYREAVREHMRELAEQAERRGEGLDEPNQGPGQEGMRFNQDQLQQLMDELQRLLEEGRTAEAAELMERLRQLMENMTVEIDPNAPGGQGQGNEAMRGLGQTLRDQQGLSDDAFNDLQNGPSGESGQEPGQDPGQGQAGEGEGEGEGQDGRSLAERQRELRQRLEDLQGGGLPGDGTEMGEAGRRQLDEAGRAMREAEEALRDGDLPGALDRQAEAMEALREGMRNFGEAMAEEQRNRQDGQAADGEAFGNADPRAQRDPLGREPGDGARIGSDRNQLQGEDVYRRAEELLDEIRRRQAEAQRPDAERDYLRRLLDLF